MGKFVVKQTNTGVKFDLKAGNGEVIATSEVYSTEAACLNGIESVRNSCVGEIEDQTAEGFETVKHPKFEMYTDKAGEFRFRLKARNGEIIATSEGYKSKANCLNGIDSVKRNAPDAPVEKID
ncbi:MAG: YegP family protein [Clostridia bacterium]|nr:YegP family protein [Clostridia bacterium]